MKYNKYGVIIILIIIILTFSYINSKRYIIEGNNIDKDRATKSAETVEKKNLEWVSVV